MLSGVGRRPCERAYTTQEGEHGGQNESVVKNMCPSDIFHLMNETRPTLRAVGAGPASVAAAGPIFGQLTLAKMPYEI